MNNVNLVKVEGPEQGAEHVFGMIKEELENKRLNVLGLATGSTMIPVYKKWVESDLDFKGVITFNLDEYVGIGAASPNSYAYFMNEHLFDKKKFKETHIANGLADDLDEECASYEAMLNENPLDIQLLGVGENGHIAFNEPGTPFDSVTHVAELTDSTLGVNSQYFENDEAIPETAITMGIQSITNAKKLILLAFGEKKRAAISKLLEGTVTTEWPITKLLEHKDVTVITDLDV
ncbi:glucosamine-6-phosphate deaminase [Filibacter tadaridae]|uniref:Glucosamine-6-phosphate deaminase n=1 Tax=Filibacter tadaridae TaxID=2483811 RepID=A0A3P5WSH2_9BACL|nr:glucosamine-6-phosphate deaminase [Filibacter tadaridae]VDC24648.1 Glucosamine-6-phosphate deaminase [Filibacter tadaridae]